MSDKFVDLVKAAGGEDFIPYLTAMGITTIPILARIAQDEQTLVKDVVTPFIDGTKIGGHDFKSSKLPVVTKSIFTVMWEDAVAAREIDRKVAAQVSSPVSQQTV